MALNGFWDKLPNEQTSFSFLILLVTSFVRLKILTAAQMSSFG